MTQCTTVAVEESCVAQIYNDCETSCSTTASTECETSCTQSCDEECTTTATTETGPSCIELCMSDCDAGDGEDHCGSASHKGPCNRCAMHNCEKRCEAKCGGDAEKPKKITSTTECMPTCTNACSASCTAKVNTQCQVDCQERTYTQCEQTMVQNCQTECKDKGGAIFCDGQFLNATDLQSCADELRAKIDIDIDIDATVTTVGNSAKKATSDVGKKIDKACTVANVGGNEPMGKGALAAPFVLMTIAGWRLQRRRSKR